MDIQRYQINKIIHVIYAIFYCSAMEYANTEIVGGIQ